MAARIAAISVLFFALLTRTPTFASMTATTLDASGVTTSAPAYDVDPNIAALNHRLSSLVISGHTPAIFPQPRVGVPALPVTRRERNRPFLLTPAVLQLVTRYNRAERLLHYRGNGLDVNLWGVFDDGHGMRVHYTLKF